jgi:hypothetical protein
MIPVNANGEQTWSPKRFFRDNRGEENTWITMIHTPRCLLLCSKQTALGSACITSGEAMQIESGNQVKSGSSMI